MADCQGSCSGFCEDGCHDACGTVCNGTCEGGCSLSCTDVCTGCTGSCFGTCMFGCTNACVSSCALTCNNTCKEGCLSQCKGQCVGYCATICQTYCETQQTFSLNTGYTSAVGTGQFGWSSTVASGETILISASDWNTLKGYIQQACQYCDGISPSQSDVTRGDIITADRYNDLANGINVSNVSGGPNGTIISADIINQLSSEFNSRKILNSKPGVRYDPADSTGTPYHCCQKGMTCVTEVSLSWQKCRDQTASTCGNQTPGS